MRGEPINKDKITVRTEGGENSDTILINETVVLTVGSEYIFFLGRPEVAGSYYTKGDHYYITGISQGIFEATTKMIKNNDGKLVPQKFAAINNDIELDYLSFMDEIEKYNETQPVDELYFQKLAYENLKKNLESGFMSMKEYEAAIEEMGRYATIIEK